MVGRYLLVAGLLCVVAAGCKKADRKTCHDAVEAYWRREGVVAFFSEFPAREAIERCTAELSLDEAQCVVQKAGEVGRCGVELAIDKGWENQWTCFTKGEPRRWRCERSNRECEYYRQLAVTRDPPASSCRPVSRVFAVVKAGKHRATSPTMEECQASRARLARQGGDPGQCEEMPDAEAMARAEWR